MPSRRDCWLSVVTAMVALMGCGGEEPAASSAASSATGGGGGSGGEAPAPPDAGIGEWPCQAGELELGDGTCLPAGIPASACGDGFAPTTDASCEPVLPAAPCGDGEMAIPGETACRPVAPCAAGTWGDIPVDATTQFVDLAYLGGGSDGSAAKPWTTIQPAIDAVVDGGIVAIAAGTYVGPLLVQDKRVRLWGRCPSLVRVSSSDEPAIRFEQGTDGSELRDLAFSADLAVGVHVGGGSHDVSIDRVWVQNAGLIGFDIEGSNPGASITRSLVEDTGGIGIFGYGATLLVEDSVIRDIAHSSDGDFGTGIRVFSNTGVPTDLTVRHSVVSGTWGAGIFASASSVHVADVVILDVQPHPVELDDGDGILALDGDGAQSSLEVAGSYLAHTYTSGIRFSRSSGEVRSTMIRDVIGPEGFPGSYGIAAAGDAMFPDVTLTVRSTVVEKTRVYGIVALDAAAVVEASIVRDTEPLPGGLPGVPLGSVGGRGIGMESLGGVARPSMRISGALIERTHEIGITALASDILIESTRVTDVAARSTDGLFGRGINVQVALDTLIPSSAVVRRSLVEGAHDHGIMLLDSPGTIESTWVRDTLPSKESAFSEVPVFFGRGIGVQGHLYGKSDVSATVEDVLVEGSHEAGIFVCGAEASIHRTVVRNTEPGSPEDGLFGDGIIGVPMPDAGPVKTNHLTSIQVRDSIVEGSTRVGVSSFGSTVELSGVYLSCNAIDLDGEVFGGIDFSFTDDGGNACLCGSEVRACKAVSSGVEPPSPSLQ